MINFNSKIYVVYCLKKLLGFDQETAEAAAECLFHYISEESIKFNDLKLSNDGPYLEFSPGISDYGIKLCSCRIMPTEDKKDFNIQLLGFVRDGTSTGTIRVRSTRYDQNVSIYVPEGDLEGIYYINFMTGGSGFDLSYYNGEVLHFLMDVALTDLVDKKYLEDIIGYDDEFVRELGFRPNLYQSRDTQSVSGIWSRTFQNGSLEKFNTAIVDVFNKRGYQYKKNEKN